MNILPNLDDVRKIAATGKYDVLPVSLEIFSDFTTPIETMRILKTCPPITICRNPRRQAKPEGATPSSALTRSWKLVGYFSYDYLGYSEPAVRCDVEDTEDFKDVDLMLFDKEQFCDMVEKAKHYIREGDIFQIVLSKRFGSKRRRMLRLSDIVRRIIFFSIRARGRERYLTGA